MDTYDISDLYANVNETSEALDEGQIDASTARRNGAEACLSFLGVEPILEAAAEALGVDISGWDDHRRRSAATVLSLLLSYPP